MSVKLSELLRAAVGELTRASYGMKVQGFADSVEERHARAFRAIAPALVELVAAHDVREQRTEVECVNAIHRINAASAALSAAMKEAGVTCE